MKKKLGSLNNKFYQSSWWTHLISCPQKLAEFF